MHILGNKPGDCWKIAAIDSYELDWIESKI